MPSKLKRLLTHQVVQNTAALYGVQFFRKIIPLLSIPYLTRTLGPVGWGSMAFVVSSVTFLILLVEFGFNITATREIARNRESKHARADIVAGVVGVQFALFSVGIVGAYLIALRIPMLSANPSLLLAGFFFAASQCFVPLWFFQGMEWMRSASTMEITGKVLALGGLVIFVHKPEDAWKALALQALPFSIQSFLGVWMMYREVPFRFPSVPLMFDALSRGWTMFLFRSGAGLYSTGNAFILGLFAGPVFVGYYAAAEKINSALLGLINPIQEALFPRLSRLAAEAPEKAARLASIGAALTGVVGLVLPISVYFAAPLLIRILAGPKFMPSVGVLRIMVLLIPFASLTISLGMQWLLPIGKDKVVTSIILAGGVLNVCLASLLAPRFMHIGSAWAAVISEAFVGTATLWATIKYTGILRDNIFLAKLLASFKNRRGAVTP